MNSSKQYLLKLNALLIFLWMPITLLAQESSVDQDSIRAYELDEIIISANKYPQDPETVGRNVSIITKEELEQSAYRNVSDILAEQQSIHMIGSGQTPGSLQQGFLRNSNSNHSVVLIDGIRISDPSTNDNTLNLSELSLAGIERVEVVRGAHSTLYGSSAIGGVINIITRKKGKPGLNTSLVTQHGRFGKGTYATENRLHLNYTQDGWYTNIGLNKQYSAGLDATIDTTSNNFSSNDQDDFQKTDLIGKVGYQTDYYDFYVSGRLVGQHADVDKGAYQDDDNAFTDYGRYLFKIGAEVTPLQNLSIEYNGASSVLYRDFVDDSSMVANGIYDGTYVESNSEGSLLENELKSIWQGEDINLVAGTSFSHQTMSTRNYTFSRYQNTIYENITDLDTLGLKETIYNGYIQSNINGGLFSDQLEMASLGLGGRYISHDEFGSHVTYEINPKLQLGENTLLYGSVATGFNAPSLYQLYSPAMQPGAYTTRGNDKLKPETSVSYEIGWREQFHPGIDVELSVFNTQVSDVIEYVYLWDNTIDQSNLGSFDYRGDTYLNISKQDIKGLEISTSAHLIPELSLNGNLSLTKSTLTFSEEDIDVDYTGNNHVQIYESGQFIDGYYETEGLTRRPKLNAFFSATFRPRESLRFKVDSRFVGSRDDVFYSLNLGPYGALDHSELEGYNVTDFSVNYALSNQVNITAKIENILDSDYMEIIGYNSRGRGFFVKAAFTL